MDGASAQLPPLVRGLRLGFGCSALVGGRTARESRYLLDAAWDAGIRHFDVARVYGTGDAEAIVGEFAVQRRAELTIATKFGIEPLPPSPATALLKRTVRVAFRRSGRLLALARRYSRHTAKTGMYAPSSARTSFETSLRQLRSEYVDVLLMHECSAQDWEDEATRRVLEELRHEGRVLAYGTATGAAETTRILSSGAARPAVAQFDSDAFSRHAARLQPFASESVFVNFSVIGGSLPRLARALEDPELRTGWERTLDLSLRGPDEIAALLLSHALWSNPFGLVLISSGSPARSAGNARLAAERGHESERMPALEGLLGALDPGVGPARQAQRSAR